jgi:hypothetical protein
MNTVEENEIDTILANPYKTKIIATEVFCCMITIIFDFTIPFA